MDNNLKIFGKQYYNLGFNVTCITKYLSEHNFRNTYISKTPYHSIEELKSKRQELNDFNQLDWENAIGVGMVLSDFSSGIDNYIAIDIDGCQDENIIDKILQILGLDMDYEWIIKSGSQNGFHIIIGANDVEVFNGHYYTEDLEIVKFNKVIENICGSYKVKTAFKNKIEKFEILSSCNLVLPPSTHISTMKYSFLNQKFPLLPPDSVEMKRIKKFIKFFGYETVIMPDSSLGEIIRKNFKSNVNLTEVSIRKHKKFRLQNSHKNPTYTLIFDCETTGLPPNNNIPIKEIHKWPRLIQISWIILDRYDYIIKKKTELVYDESFTQSTSVNIDFAILKDIGKPIREVLNSFSKDLKEVDKVVAHNIDFDMKIVQAEFYRHGMEDLFQGKSTRCTMKDVHEVLYEGKSNFNKFLTLQQLHKILLGEKFIGSHNAISDVLATTRCYVQLRKNKIEPFLEDD